MMGYSDRHARALMRLISPNTLLFTEMVVASALLMGDKNRFLLHAADEPCALQLGGSEPKQLSEASQLSEQAGYQEINLNVGCPSDRVQQGEIGACLMGKPNLVAECISAMQAAVEIPVTVKCRIGIDDQDSFDHFRHFIDTVSSAGCDVFYVHARAAWLQGLSPKKRIARSRRSSTTTWKTFKKSFPISHSFSTAALTPPMRPSTTSKHSPG